MRRRRRGPRAAFAAALALSASPAGVLVEGALGLPSGSKAAVAAKDVVRGEAAQPPSGAGKGASSPGEDDCKIFVVLGRALLGWGKTPPDRSQFAIFYRPEGRGYVEQCPWRRLGVAAPPLGAPDPDRMRFFTEPAYLPGARARVSFITRLVAAGPGGRRRGPYINQLDLILVKHEGTWRITERLQGPVT